MITSAQNPKLRYMQRLLAERRFRLRESRMALEGLRLVEEALAGPQPPELVLASEDLERSERGRKLREAIEDASIPLIEVEPGLMRGLSDTIQPQGVLAAAPIPNLPLPEAPGCLLILDRLRDPGNLGSILRSAGASGVDAVLLAPESVELSNPKVLRAAMGAHFRLPLRHMDWSEIDGYLEGLSRRPALWIADAAGERRYDQLDWTQPIGLIIGGEAEGASEAAVARAAGRISIPMPGAAESLNAAAAAAVMLFERARQRTRT